VKWFLVGERRICTFSRAGLPLLRIAQERPVIGLAHVEVEVDGSVETSVAEQEWSGGCQPCLPEINCRRTLTS